MLQHNRRGEVNRPQSRDEKVERERRVKKNKTPQHYRVKKIDRGAQKRKGGKHAQRLHALWVSGEQWMGVCRTHWVIVVTEMRGEWWNESHTMPFSAEMEGVKSIRGSPDGILRQ